MGLDMYLLKTKKVDGYTIKDFYLADDYVNWKDRGAYCSFKDWCGTDEEDIDMDIINKLMPLMKTTYHDSADSSNYLAFGNNNWFQANLITPSGEWIDLTETDNILSDNLLECFENIERIIALKNWGYPTVKFISYSGEYPNLCSGDLVLEINGEIVTFEKYSYSMSSTGSIKYNNELDYYETSKGPWKVELPQEYNYLDEIVTALVNENVPWGCCGGCI